jgi:hypothetical protein
MPENLKEITFYDQGRSALRIVEGGSMGDMYAYDWRRNEKGEVLIGTNGLPTLDQSKYIKLGNALPDWFGGLNNTFSYKGLTLNVLLEVAAFIVEFDVLIKKVNDATAEIYMNEYTKEDVKAMLAFYNSPTGKKMAEKSEVITEKSQAAMMSLQGEMQTMMMKYAQ